MQNLANIIPFGKATKWYTTHIDSYNGHIYCQLSEPSISVRYERLYQSINGWGKAGRLAKCASDPVIGELVLSHHKKDKRWYRVQITQVNHEESTVEAFFVDYGKTEHVAFTTLYDLPSQFAEVIPHAYECILDGVEPVFKSEKWNDRAIELVKELALDQERPGIPVRLSRNILVLKLFADPDGTVTVGDQLISAGYGQGTISSTPAPSIIERSNSVSSDESINSRKSSELNLSIPFKKLEFQAGQYLDLLVCHCDGVNKFFCQQVNTNEKKELDLMEKLMQEAHENKPAQPGKTWKLNEPCCVKSISSWCRGIVKRIGSSSCSVFLIDYGTTQSISVSNMREPVSDIFGLPAFAFECCLNSVAPLPGEETFSAKSKEVFESFLKENAGGPMVGYVVNKLSDKAELILYDKRDESINQKLTEAGVVVAGESPQATPRVPNGTKAPNSVKERGLTKYREMSFQVGQEANCYVSYTYGPHSFYINLASSKDDLDQLMENIAAWVQNKDLVQVERARVGQPCLVMFSEDEAYYRGEVVGQKESKSDVMFVDYGNKETKQLTELKEVPEEFMTLEKQAVECKLKDINPIAGNEYSDSACTGFEELTLEKTLHMKVANILQEKVLSVNLVEENVNNVVPQVDIASAMVSAGLAQRASTTVVKSNYGEPVMSDSARFPEMKVDLNSYVDVAPVHVTDPSYFCCHLVQHAVKFKDMTEQLNAFYKKSIADHKMKWKKMMPCVALFEEDNCWYRAMIVGCTGVEKFEVTFVDFGNSSVVSAGNLRPICSDFMKLSAQVFVCALCDVSPKGGQGWSDAAVNGLDTLVLDRHLTAFVKGKDENNLYSVVLYDTTSSPEVNVAQWLIDQGHAVTASSKTSSTSGCSVRARPQPSEEVYVSVVNNPGDLWVQLSRLSPELDILMEKLYNFYSSLAPKDLCLSNPVIGQYCCAIFPEDEGWYRAVIEEVKGNSIRVRYIDYGNSELVDIENVKVLTNEFEASPSYALPCHISGLQAYPSWDPSVNDLLLDQSFNACFNALTVDNASLEVKLEKDGISLTNKLKELQCEVDTSLNDDEDEDSALISEPDPTKTDNVVKSCNIEVGDRIQLCMLHSTSPHSFYAQLMDTEEEYQAMVSEITKMDCPSLPNLNASVGTFCLAKCKDMKQWGRGEVLRTQGQNFHIEFFDFGVVEKDVQANEIKELPIRLSHLWKQAIVGSFSNIKPTGALWSNGAVELFESFCLEKAVMMTEVTATENMIIHLTPFNGGGGKGDLTKQLVQARFAAYVDGNRTVSPTNQQKSVPPKKMSQDTCAGTFAMPVVTAKESGYCTYVHNSILVSVQLKKYEDDIGELMDHLATHCKSANQPTSLSVGNICAALCSDGGWYRAAVTAANGDTVEVCFVDYGNSECVSVSATRVLSSQFVKLPQTSLSCSLHEVYDVDIDLDASKVWLEQNVQDQLIVMDVIEKTDNSASVSATIYLDEMNINDHLYAEFELDGGEEEEEETEAVPQEPQQQQQQQQQNTLKFRSYEIGPGTHLKAFCIFVEPDQKCLMLQLISLCGDSLINLMDGIKEFCSETPAVVPSVTTGMACLSLYSEDATWYRTEVTNISGDDVTILFVDYGNSDIVKASQIHVIPDRFVAMPRACMPYTMNEIVGIDSVFETVQPFLEELIDIELELVVSNVLPSGELTGDLFCKTVFSNTLVHTVCEMFNLTRKGEEGAVDAKGEPEVVKKEPLIAMEDLQIMCNYLKGTYEAVCFVVDSAVKLRCQLVSYQDQLEELMVKIADVADTAKPLGSVKQGQVCLAKYSLDDVWYRGRIIEGNHVEFLDYGNEEVVDPSNIRVLPIEFASLPQACISVILHDVHVDDIDAKATKTWLEGHVIEREVKLEVVSMDAESCVEAYVYLGENEGHINDEIYSLFALGEDSGEIVGSTTSASAGIIESTPGPSTLVIEEPISVETVPAVELAPIGVTVTIPPPNMAVDGRLYGTCFVVESAIMVKCQLVSYVAQLDELMEQIAAVAETTRVLNKVEKGQVCLAKYSLDEGWYRGRILEDNKVEFIDYGNEEVVDSSDIRVLPTGFELLPQTCVSVILHDVHLDDIDVVATMTWLVETVLDRKVNFEIVNMKNENCVEAYVYVDESEGHINDQIYQLFALEENEALEEAEAPSSEVVVDQEVESTQVEPASSTVEEVLLEPQIIAASEIPAPELFAEDLVFDGTCFVVESAIKVKCQINKYVEELGQLMANIAEIGETSPCLTELRPGQLCLAKYSLDEGWYRGRMLQGNRVEFVDYGNEEEVDSSLIRILPAEFAVLPQVCVSVILHDVHLDDIDAEATKTWLDECLTEKEVKIEVALVSGPLCVEAYLYLEGSAEHINDGIYAKFAGNVDIVEEINQLATPALKELLAMSIPPPELKLNETYTAWCSHVESAVVIKCQLEMYIEQLEKLMAEIAEIGEEANPLQKFEVGQICLAKFSEDEVWYRGRIIQDGKVEFIDYGNWEEYHISNIRVMPVEFMSLPQACVSVGLHDVHLDDIEADATKSWLDECVAEKTVRIEVTSMEDPFSIEGYVYIESNTTHINDEIYEQFEAMHDAETGSASGTGEVSVYSTPQPTDEAEEQEAADVSSVVEGNVENVATEAIDDSVASGSTLPASDVAPNNIYATTCFVIDSAVSVRCQLSSYQEELEELMANLAAKAGEAPLLEHFDAGTLCIAKYDVDDAWYRARIVSEQSVEFIDYGNQSTVERSNLKVLSPEFMEIPQTCIEVGLHDVHVDDINTEAAKAWLEANVLEAEVTLEVVEVSHPCSVGAFIYLKGSRTHVNDQIYELFAKEIANDESVDETVEHSLDEPPTETPTCTDVVDTSALKSTYTDIVVDTSVLKSIDLAVDTVYIGICYGVVSTAQLRLHLTNYQEELSDLMAKLSASAETAQIITNPTVGQLCISKHATEDGWYRARIVEDGKVEFLDYGNTADMVSDVRVLLPEFVSFPQCSIPVTLHDVHLDDIDVEAAQLWLQSNLLERIVRIEVVSVSNSGVVSAYVYKEGCDTHINDELYELYANETVSMVSHEDDVLTSPETLDSEDGSTIVDGKLSAVCITVISERFLICNINGSSAYASFTLQDVNPDDLDVVKCRAWLKDVCLGKQLVFHVDPILCEDGSYNSYAYIDDNDTSVNDLMYEQFPVGAESEGEPPSPTAEGVEVKSPSGKDVPEETSNQNGLVNGHGDPSFCVENVFSWPLLNVGDVQDVTLTAVDNATTLRCQFVKYKERLRKMMNAIALEVDNQPGVRFLEKGDPVIAQSEDLFWYRGRVLSTSESTARVEFVDYGTSDEIITEDMRVMKREMLSDHVFCIKCVLNNVVVGEERQKDAVEYLHKTLVESGPVVTITVNGIDYDKEIASVTLTQKGENINSFMNSTYGPCKNSFRQREIVLGEEMGLTPLPGASSISDFPCVFSDSVKELESLMQSLTEYYSEEENQEPLAVLDIGAPCCVRQDDKWYRGSVKGVEGSTVGVHFVDYGFTENVLSDNIFELDTAFFQLEVQAIDCKLFDLLRSQDPDADSWSSDSVDYFNTICADKHMTATVINKTKNLYSVALTFDNGETVYEMLTQQHSTRPNE